MTIKDFIEKYDVQNQFEVLRNSYKQIEYVRDFEGLNISFNSDEIKSIVVAGLGGSAIGADLFYNLYLGEIRIPYFVNRNYGLPPFVGNDTLVVLSSYSGNTEETLSAAEEAWAKNAKIVCITSGGKLQEFAEAKNIPYVKLQTGFQPRYALYLNLFALIKIFASIGIISSPTEFVEKAIELLNDKGKDFAEYENAEESNAPLEFAKSLIGFIPVIYSVDNVTSAVGVRLKGQFNENGKTHAFHNVLPEFNHNEIIGWETFSEKQFRAKAVFIKDVAYHPQIKKRIDITAGLIKNAGAGVLHIESSQEDFKLRLLENVFFGDWVTYYFAVLRGKDPSEIDYIHYLKNKLAEN